MHQVDLARCTTSISTTTHLLGTVNMSWCEVVWHVRAVLANLSITHVMLRSPRASGAEIGINIVRTHGQEAQITGEVLHGVLYPKAHNDGFKNKNKTKNKQSFTVIDLGFV